MFKITQADIDNLPLDSKIALVEAIWDSIAASKEEIGMPEWHKPILDRRLEDVKGSPDAQSTWEQSIRRLLKDT